MRTSRERPATIALTSQSRVACPPIIAACGR
jgi:hypothetical protein